MSDQDHSIDLTSPEPPQRAVDAGAAPDADLALTPDGPPGDDGPTRAGSSAARRRRRGSRGGRGRRRASGADGADELDDADGGAEDERADDAEDEPAAAAAGAERAEPATAARVGSERIEPAGTAGAAAERTSARSVRGEEAGGPARQRRGSRTVEPVASDGADPEVEASGGRRRKATGGELPEELPDRPIEGRILDVEAADRALVRKPQIGDSRPAPVPASPPHVRSAKVERTSRERTDSPAVGRNKRRRKTSRASGAQAKGHVAGPVALDSDVLERRRGRERNGRPVGRYLMCVHVRPELVQIAVLQGRNLIEHYVSRPQDDVAQIHGNIYLGRVQNVLPGMEAAFVDIGTPKNAVLYRGDVQYDAEDLLEPRGKAAAERPRIEQLLKNKQLIVCQVTKNPIGAKGARLTQEVSLPGRFVVLIPNSRTYGISKRLADDERRRLRSILDRVKPEEHGLIVRTAAENVSEEELRADVLRLAAQWEKISARGKQARGPALLYREPGLAVRVIREELNADYRGVVIDDPDLFAEVRDYVGALNPELADRIERYDEEAEGLPIFERHHVHEQLHKALDRKVWLPSGGSLIIEHTEALTVIDVNTGKNVGTSNLEETVFHNNLEAADEIARQLRLRDIGGIIVIDFIDMEIRENRHKVVAAFRDALARDKTRTQVFDISELGLVEMTRKRIGEGLLTAFAHTCPNCEGRGLVVDHSLIG
jgi:ribonuclease E